VLTQFVAYIGKIGEIVLSACEFCGITDYEPQPERKPPVRVQKALGDGLAP
jgi:hypothetical protein